MDYPVTEQLTRSIAFERMKQLADAYLEAKERNDYGMMHALTRERQELKMQFMKVVK